MRELLVQAIGALEAVAVPLSMFNLGLEAGRPYVLRLLRRPGYLLRFVLVTPDVPAFVVNRGGEYCFIPGLRGLAALDT